MYARLALFVGRQTRFVQLKRLLNDYALLQLEGTVSLPLFLLPDNTRATNTDRDIISHELQDQTCTTEHENKLKLSLAIEISEELFIISSQNWFARVSPLKHVHC